MPKVTVITASYNYAEYIGQTIESVINQTYTDWEMLVIDDGSKDNSVEVINEYTKNDTRVKLLTHQNNENRGLVETLKLGISQAQGEYIVFLESDDYIREDYLAKKLDCFDKYESIGLVYNKVHTFGNDLSPKWNHWLNKIDNYWKQHDYPHNIHNLYSLGNYIPTFSCVMIKSKLLQNINWSLQNPAWLDLWLWTQISNNCDVYYIQDEMTYWRIHKTSYLNTSKENAYDCYKFYVDIFLSEVSNFNNVLYKILFLKRCFIRILYYKYLDIINKLRKQ